MNNSNQRSQVLYRFFDADDNLLYVGISVSIEKRFHDHEKRSTWWDEAAYCLFERFPSRDAVRKAEEIAIKTENPKYNKDLNPNYESANHHFRKIKSWVLGEAEPPEDHRFLVKTLRYIRSEDAFWNKQSKHLAYHLMEGQPFLERDNRLCENCKAMYQKRFLQDWARYSARDRQESQLWL